MDIRAVPTLSLDGWINDPLLKLNKLYEHFVASEYSQTFTYTDNVSSLKYLIKKYKEDQELLRTKIEDTLEVYLERYFDKVLVEVLIEEIIDSNSFNLNIFIEVTDSDGKTVNTSFLNSININEVNDRIKKLNENYY